MKNIAGIIISVIISLLLLAGCASKESTTVSSVTTSSAALSATSTISQSPVSSWAEPGPGLQSTEEKFVNMIMQAINQDDIPVLAKYYDSIYGETQPDEIKRLSEGLKLYHEHIKGEKLVRFESGKNIEGARYDTPNTTGKQYYFISENGIKRDIIIKCFTNEEISFKYNDPLLFYGPEVAVRTEAYFNAIKTKNISYLYDYIRIAQEDSDSISYSDPNHNKEYAALAEKTVENYEKAFKLDSIQFELTGKISDAYYNTLKIEYKIFGISPQGKPTEHLIYGVYEFPMWGVNDKWWEDK